jgi:ribosomal protein S14
MRHDIITLSRLVRTLRRLNGWGINKALYEVVRSFGLSREEVRELVKLI